MPTKTIAGASHDELDTEVFSKMDDMTKSSDKVFSGTQEHTAGETPINVNPSTSSPLNTTNPPTANPFSDLLTTVRDTVNRLVAEGRSDEEIIAATYPRDASDEEARRKFEEMSRTDADAAMTYFRARQQEVEARNDAVAKEMVKAVREARVGKGKVYWFGST